MNLLQNARIYLAGPIEKETDDGIGWRAEIAPKIGELGAIVWDPLVKPEWFNKECGCLYDGEKQREDFKLLSGESVTYDYSKVEYALHRNRTVRKICLRLVSACDIVICKVSGRTVGTFEELYIANSQGKPILFLYENGLDSSWRMIQFDGAKHFDNIDSLVEYLKLVSNGGKIDDNQWIFLPERWPNASSITS